MDTGNDFSYLVVTLYQMLTSVVPFAAADLWRAGDRYQTAAGVWKPIFGSA